jgi:hypothetical protein
MGLFYANVGPAHGLLMYRDVPGAIGVVQAPDKPMPIGTALWTGRHPSGVALWRLTVRDAELPGRWFLFDRHFESAEESVSGPGRLRIRIPLDAAGRMLDGSTPGGAMCGLSAECRPRSRRRNSSNR